MLKKRRLILKNTIRRTKILIPYYNSRLTHKFFVKSLPASIPPPPSPHSLHLHPARTRCASTLPAPIPSPPPRTRCTSTLLALARPHLPKFGDSSLRPLSDPGQRLTPPRAAGPAPIHPPSRWNTSQTSPSHRRWPYKVASSFVYPQTNLSAQPQPSIR